jgi:hypothetical protein
MSTTIGNPIFRRPRNTMSHRPALLTLVYVLLLCTTPWLSGPAAGSPNKTKTSRSQVRTQTESQAQTNAKTNKTLDACSLLTEGEVAAAIGEPLQERKPSVQTTGNMKMSHCLFVTRNFAKSASLAVTTTAADDAGAHSLRVFWRSQFHSPRKPEEQKRPASREVRESKADGKSQNESNSWSDGEAGEAASKPRAIPALGEEAYWVGSPISGALYVLHDALFVRISVGGIPNESTRIAKSKSLATAILLRLPH